MEELKSTMGSHPVSLPPAGGNTEKPEKACYNCKTTRTPLWRKEAGELLCNACGIYFKSRGVHRPVELIRAQLNNTSRRAGASGSNGNDGSRPRSSNGQMTRKSSRKRQERVLYGDDEPHQLRLPATATGKAARLTTHADAATLFHRQLLESMLKYDYSKPGDPDPMISGPHSAFAYNPYLSPDEDPRLDPEYGTHDGGGSTEDDDCGSDPAARRDAADTSPYSSAEGAATGAGPGFGADGRETAVGEGPGLLSRVLSGGLELREDDDVGTVAAFLLRMRTAGERQRQQQQWPEGRGGSAGDSDAPGGFSSGGGYEQMPDAARRGSSQEAAGQGEVEGGSRGAGALGSDGAAAGSGQTAAEGACMVPHQVVAAGTLSPALIAAAAAAAGPGPTGAAPVAALAAAWAVGGGGLSRATLEQLGRLAASLQHGVLLPDGRRLVLLGDLPAGSVAKQQHETAAAGGGDSSGVALDGAAAACTEAHPEGGSGATPERSPQRSPAPASPRDGLSLEGAADRAMDGPQRMLMRLAAARAAAVGGDALVLEVLSRMRGAAEDDEHRRDPALKSQQHSPEPQDVRRGHLGYNYSGAECATLRPSVPYEVGSDMRPLGGRVTDAAWQGEAVQGRPRAGSTSDRDEYSDCRRQVRSSEDGNGGGWGRSGPGEMPGPCAEPVPSGGGGRQAGKCPPPPPRPPRNHRGPLLCANCGTTQTPLWRKDRETGATMCNACGIYKQTHGFDRPVGGRQPAPQHVAKRCSGTQRTAPLRTVPVRGPAPAADPAAEHHHAAPAAAAAERARHHPYHPHHHHHHQQQHHRPATAAPSPSSWPAEDDRAAAGQWPRAARQQTPPQNAGNGNPRATARLSGGASTGDGGDVTTGAAPHGVGGPADTSAPAAAAAAVSCDHLDGFLNHCSGSDLRAAVVRAGELGRAAGGGPTCSGTSLGPAASAVPVRSSTRCPGGAGDADVAPPDAGAEAGPPAGVEAHVQRQPVSQTSAGTIASLPLGAGALAPGGRADQEREPGEDCARAGEEVAQPLSPQAAYARLQQRLQQQQHNEQQPRAAWGCMPPGSPGGSGGGGGSAASHGSAQSQPLPQLQQQQRSQPFPRGQPSGGAGRSREDTGSRDCNIAATADVDRVDVDALPYTRAAWDADAAAAGAGRRGSSASVSVSVTDDGREAPRPVRASPGPDHASFSPIAAVGTGAASAHPRALQRDRAIMPMGEEAEEEGREPLRSSSESPRPIRPVGLPRRPFQMTDDGPGLALGEAGGLLVPGELVQHLMKQLQAVQRRTGGELSLRGREDEALLLLHHLQQQEERRQQQQQREQVQQQQREQQQRDEEERQQQQQRELQRLQLQALAQQRLAELRRVVGDPSVEEQEAAVAGEEVTDRRQPVQRAATWAAHPDAAALVQQILQQRQRMHLAQREQDYQDWGDDVEQGGQQQQQQRWQPQGARQPWCPAAGHGVRRWAVDEHGEAVEEVYRPRGYVGAPVAHVRHVGHTGQVVAGRHDGAPPQAPRPPPHAGHHFRPPPQHMEVMPGPRRPAPPPTEGLHHFAAHPHPRQHPPPQAPRTRPPAAVIVAGQQQQCVRIHAKALPADQLQQLHHLRAAGVSLGHLVVRPPPHHHQQHHQQQPGGQQQQQYPQHPPQARSQPGQEPGGEGEEGLGSPRPLGHQLGVGHHVPPQQQARMRQAGAVVAQAQHRRAAGVDGVGAFVVGPGPQQHGQLRAVTSPSGGADPLALVRQGLGGPGTVAWL